MFSIIAFVQTYVGDVHEQDNARVQTNDEHFSASQMEWKPKSNARTKLYFRRSHQLL